MWVADMDFEVAPAIVEALQKKVDHKIFGYTEASEEWAKAYISWWKRRHGFEIDKEWLIFCTGVIPALSSLVRRLTLPAENVVVMTPVYNHFFSSICNNGRNALESVLVYEDGAYHVDWEDLEEKLANPQSSMMILCNPQNPGGIIWDLESLEKIGALCEKHHVLVVSDEIHCDITIPGKSYIPFASVNECCKNNSVTCIAPTKCFNMPGLQTSAVCIPNPVIRHKVWRGFNTEEIAEGNIFSYDAAIAAFNHGEEWLKEMCAYVAENRKFAEEFIDREIPQLYAIRGEATYLMWIDVSKLGMPSDKLCEKIYELTGLYLSEGGMYRGDGKNFVRFNMACPRSRLVDGLNRLKKAAELISAEK